MVLISLMERGKHFQVILVRYFRADDGVQRADFANMECQVIIFKSSIQIEQIKTGNRNGTLQLRPEEDRYASIRDGASALLCIACHEEYRNSLH